MPLNKNTQPNHKKLNGENEEKWDVTLESSSVFCSSYPIRLLAISDIRVVGDYSKILRKYQRRTNL